MFKPVFLALTIVLAQIQDTNTNQQDTNTNQQIEYVSNPVVQETVDIPQEERNINRYDERQIRCLAENTYHEARGESRNGQIAVLNVVMNRVEDNRFPDTPCEVDNQRNRRGCQFSWVCHGTRGIRERVTYDRLYNMAVVAYFEELRDYTRGAAFYHANYVRPSWSYRMNRTVQIGTHIFYRG